jgi:hypothetical protein
MILASIMACLSFVPFEYVAKGSLLFAVLLFVVDPIPPVSRLLSLFLVVVVGIVSKLHRQYTVIEEDEFDNDDANTFSSDSTVMVNPTDKKEN